MPGPYVVPVHGDAELPKEVDVVVIGGGIIGTSTALELVDQGCELPCVKKAASGTSNRAETGVGCVFPAATRAKCP